MIYEFVDTTEHAQNSVLPSEAVSVNGTYLEDIIDGYRTLYVKGRESLGVELNTYSVGSADGEKVKGKRYPSRTLTVGFQLLAGSNEEFRDRFNQLNNILSLDEADFIFNDEMDKFFAGVPVMNATIEEGRNNVIGEWQIYCAYPFKRSIEPITISSEDETGVVVDDTSATFSFRYNGTVPAHPVLRAEFAGALENGNYNEDGDCGYVAFLDEDENIIQLGNPEVVDVDQYSRNATLVNKRFTDISDWQTSGGQVWNGAINGSVSVGNITDTYWNGGKGQTQSYAKPTYSGSGGPVLWQNTSGAVDFEFDIVHRLCVSENNQVGTFECAARNETTGKIVAGFVIDKTGAGTTGTVKYILNDTVVGTDNIDLSYYNTHFGYCNRTAVYVQETYQQKVVTKVKKKVKKNKYKTVSQVNWVTKTRTVQRGWNYTQSNLNSGFSKSGAAVTFSVGNLATRTFKMSDIENTPAHDVSFHFNSYGTPFHTCAIHSVSFIAKAGVTFAEIPNVFTSGDIVEADCNDANVYLYRDGSIGGHLEQEYGALGNDWEDFQIKVGENMIRAVWSDWVNPEYKPVIKIIFNEVYI